MADYHGTQVAGQVAGDGTGGIVTGMAPDAEIMGLGIDCDTPSKAWLASEYAIAKGKCIEKIRGIIIIVGEKIGIWGDLEVVPLKRKNA